MEREACVCDHGFERSDLCAEIIIIIIILGLKLQFSNLGIWSDTSSGKMMHPSHQILGYAAITAP